MVAGEEPIVVPSVGVSPERVAEAQSVVDCVTSWAEGRADVVGLLLVGSYARGAARPDSDVDLVLLSRDVAGYGDNSWINELALGELIRVKTWGETSSAAHAAASTRAGVLTIRPTPPCATCYRASPVVIISGNGRFLLSRSGQRRLA